MWLVLEKGTSLGVGFLVMTLVARHLGPEDYGILSYALSFVGLFRVFSTLGLDGIVTKSLANKEQDPARLKGTTFALKAIGASFGIIFMNILQFILNDKIEFFLIIFILSFSCLIQGIASVYDIHFQSILLNKKVALAGIISLILTSSIRLISIHLGLSTIWFATITTIDSLFFLIIIYLFYNKSISTQCHWRFDIDIAKSLLQSSWPLIISGMAVSMYMKIDQIIINKILGNKATGEYAIAVQLSEAWLVLTVLITKTYLPVLSNLKLIDENLFESKIIKIYRLLFYLGLAISSITFFLSDIIVSIIFGEQYASSSMVLKIYIWSITLVYLNNVSWIWYINNNLQHYATIRLLCGLLLNIILNFMWIEKYGLAGAAYATILSYTLSSYVANLFSKATRRNFFLQSRAIFWIN